jgi:AmmeMemoRadiSam system protein B/AmmeMemoRadiSam system protein A
LEEQRPHRIIILGFAHRGGAAGISIPKVNAIKTPLGDVPLDTEVVRELAGDGVFRLASEHSVCDHSVEIQLPLLQRAVPEARITPLYVGQLQPDERREAARKLAQFERPGTVLLASSDFTHYGRDFYFQPFPADGAVSSNLRKLDEAVIEAAGSLESKLFLETLQETGSNVCGSAPIGLLLDAMAAASCDEVFQETLDYQTSGEITGDFHHSVSYAALGYFPAASFLLGAEDRALLMASARKTLDGLLHCGDRHPIFPARRTTGLTQKAGIFVSLHRKGELRGCVGTKSGDEELYRSVPQMTLSAALNDGRFAALRQGDEDVDMEISVLSPMKRISTPGRFRINVHGAYLEAGHRRGLLLPQVAEGRGWDAAQFLAALARKSGADGKAWEDPASKLFVFRAQVFGEDLVT